MKSNNFIDEVKWRNMIHDIMPGFKDFLKNNMRSAYIGFDPTSDSLHIGHLVPMMLLAHFQKSGHRPIALVGGATGMIGDPSGKSAERNLLDEKTIKTNQTKIKDQLAHFLDFDQSKDNAALLLNNLEWMKGLTFLDFIRDVGKHVTVNYMMSKDSVKNRLESGISYTEFTYQLIQGYDFYWLWKNKEVKIQFGGSDQWGNILTGNELIRRIDGGESYALTTPLITKCDGGKFGKTEDGNVWLDSTKTSPYKFYQFWINTSDEDAKKFIKEKMDSANWFIEAIAQRRITMINVMRSIIEFQPEWFGGNMDYLRPLKLQDIADKINMDISTISRSTRGKYADTPYGIFELKYFFTDSIELTDGSILGTFVIKRVLEKIIQSEDKTKPMSDDALVGELIKAGYKMARRTVAKYRDQMGYPVARLRKEI